MEQIGTLGVPFHAKAAGYGGNLSCQRPRRLHSMPIQAEALSMQFMFGCSWYAKTTLLECCLMGELFNHFSRNFASKVLCLHNDDGHSPQAGAGLCSQCWRNTGRPRWSQDFRPLPLFDPCTKKFRSCDFAKHKTLFGQQQARRTTWCLFEATFGQKNSSLRICSLTKY